MTGFLLILLGAAGALAFWYASRKRHRAALLATPLTDKQRAIVAEQVPLVRRLPGELRRKLEARMNLFLDQITFVGCDGLEVSEEMRLSIAAQACLLVVNSDTWYDHLRTILVYPGAFKSRQKQRSGYVVTERETVRTGESWPRGPVVLSWTHARQGAINESDGHNVVFHEFAHQIDDLSGHTDGVPNLDRSQTFAEWEHAFVSAFERHAQQVAGGHRTVFDPYGATGPEEFFAVAVETFFEKPAVLKRTEPEVYKQLELLFHLDPAEWA